MTAAIKACLTEVAFNNSLEKETTEESVDSNINNTKQISIAEAVRENVCLNDCSNHGDCVNGMFAKIRWNSIILTLPQC